MAGALSPSDDTKPDGSSLRAAAEAQLARAPRTDALPAAERLHELQVHQIELEMQNEALREAQNALEESRDRFADLYEFAPVGYLTVSTGGLINEVNLTAVRLLGVDRRKLLQRRFTPLVVAGDQDRWTQFFLDLKELDGTGSVELRMHRGDGAVFPAQLDCQRRRIGADGTAIRVTVSDVTERKQAQAVRDAALDLLQRIASQVPGVVYQYLLRPDGSSCFPFASAAIREIYRVSPEEVREDASKVFANLHPDDHDGIVASIQQSARNMTPWRHEYRVKFDDGTVRWLFGNAVPQGGADGSVLWHGFITDITDRKKAEAERTRLLKIIDETPDFVATSDMQTHLKFLNVAGARLVGLPDGVDVSDLEIRDMHPEWAARRVLDEGIPAVLEAGSWRGETALLHRDGHQTPVSQVLMIHRDESGNPEFLSTIMRDITAPKAAEAELEQHRSHLEELVISRTMELAQSRDAAQAANRAKSAFLANMSHEIRTPMNGILGMAYLLRRGGVTPKQADRLDKIDASAHHLLAVINAILDLSKIEAGKVAGQQADFTLSGLLQEVAAVVESGIKAKGLALHVDMVGVPQVLHGDITRLSQALVNYLGNAVKFTERGSITLTGRLIDETDADCLLRFEVTDTGIGIPEDACRSLFVPFHQVDESFTRAFGGTGLGLAITKRIAALMDGEVGVTSTVGQGSTFWLTARLGKGVAGAITPDANPVEAADVRLRRDHRGARILLAEDDPINQEVALELLRQAGLAPDLATDGREAVRLAERNDYALILMDVQMPVMNGLEAARAIRSLPGRAATPIIAKTASVFDDDRRACLDAGMNDFLAKPLQPDKVFATLLKWLDRRSSTGR